MEKEKHFFILILGALLVCSLSGPAYALKGKKGKGKNVTTHRPQGTSPLDHHRPGPIKWGWKHKWIHYYGTPSLPLRRDRQLRRAMKEAGKEKEILDQKVREIHPIQREFEQAKRSEQKLTKDISTTERQITSLQREIEKLKGSIEEAQGQIPLLEQRIAQLNQNLLQQQAQKWNKQQQQKLLQNQLLELSSQIMRAQQHVGQALQNCVAQGQTKTQCQNDPTVVAGRQKLQELTQRKVALSSQVQQLTGEIEALHRQSTQTTAQINRTRADLTKAKRIMAQGPTQMEQKKGRLFQQREKKQGLEGQLAQVSRRVETLRGQRDRLHTEAMAQNSRVNVAVQEARAIHRDLVRRTKRSNLHGYLTGKRQGEEIGLALAYDLGAHYGQNHGATDGHSRGTQEGRNREYRNGYAEGEVIGEKEANVQGKTDGKALGRERGNTLAGQRDGTLDGQQRAEASDAATVGQKQGTQDGMKRAIRDGKEQGTSLGEKQVIDEYENLKELSSVILDGPFAGTFSNLLPPYPGVPDPDVLSCQIFFRPVVRQACLAGLLSGYHSAAKLAYQRNIGNFYNQAYNLAHSTAYQQALSLYYESSYLNGKEEGRSHQFTKLYTTIKETFFLQEKEKFTAHPDKISPEYRKAFASSTKAAYDQKYEDIRFQKFSAATQETYAQNIDDQISLFTQIRREEVNSLYQNYPVIQYVHSVNKDGGVRGVAAQDGVYQPQEGIIHDITLKNYGLQPATDVRVQLTAGEGVVLAALPARSTITVKGAAKSHVTAPLGHQGQTELIVFKKLHSNDHGIEGRHFYNRASGQLNSEDKKTFPVRHPLVISHVAVEGDLLLGKEAPYSVVVENRSHRSYVGPITVRVETSLGQDVLTNSLPSIQLLQTEQKLNQGRLLVGQNRDAFENLTFNVTLSKEGVVLGQIRKVGGKLVQVEYQAKKQAPVLLGNAKKDSQTLLDTMTNLGGVERVSLLDLSLTQQNHLLSNGALSYKVIHIAQEELDIPMQRALEQIIHSAKGALIVADSDHNHLIDLLSLSSLELSTRQTMLVEGFDEQGLIFVNQYSHPSVQEVIVTESHHLPEAQQLALQFLRSDKQLITEALGALNPNQVLDILESQVIGPEQKAPIQILVGKILLNTLKAHKIFENSKEKGKALAKKMPTDPNDLLNKTLTHLDQAIQNQGTTTRTTGHIEDKVTTMIGGIIVLQELKHQLSQNEVLQEIKRPIKKSVLKRFSKKILPRLIKQLKKEAGPDFYKKFIKSGLGHSKSNRLKGLFNPIK